MRTLLLSLFFIVSCSSEFRLTGYKYGGSWDGNKVRTCNEDEILLKWWYFDTSNLIINVLVPGFEDLCVYPSNDGILFWNEIEGWGELQENWDWACSDGNTIKVLDTNTDEVYWVTIFGKDYDGCYDIETSNNGITVRGDMCPCEDPFEE